MVAHPRLILASASPARLATLKSAGLKPEVMVSGVDESQITLTEPAELALKLAQLKAIAVAAENSRAIVIGCDSVLEFDGKIYGKPEDAATATRRWKQMRGRAGILHTGHCVVDTQRDLWVSRTAATKVRFSYLSDQEIETYVATGEPLQVAGGFTLDGLGGAFVSGITGDPSNVIGISLPLLRLLFDELGLTWTDFWQH